MYNYIDEMPESTQMKACQMARDFDWWEEDYFWNAEEILDSITPTSVDKWADYEKAKLEADIDLKGMPEELWVEVYDVPSRVWNLLRADMITSEVEQEELEEELWLAQYEDLLWQRAHC